MARRDYLNSLMRDPESHTEVRRFGSGRLSGFLMWRRRRPDDALGAPPPRRDSAKLRRVAALVLLLAARWLGVAARTPARL